MKPITFWLSKEDANDKLLMDNLRAICKSLHDDGYLPVIFESGTGSLEDGLYLLLKRNIEAKAKRQLEEEKLSQSYRKEMIA